MTKITMISTAFVALAAPAALMASDVSGNVRNARCVTESITFPDGSGQSVTICETDSNGVK